MDKIAILYQAQLPPIKEGIQKPMKPGGYADSGADIAFALLKNQYHVITPVEHPNENIDKDWVFPDTEDGIKNALNKVLFSLLPPRGDSKDLVLDIGVTLFGCN